MINKQNLYRLRSLSVAAIVSLVYSTSSARIAIKSDLRILVPSPVLDRWITDNHRVIQGSETVPIKDHQLTSPLPIQLRGIRFDVAYQLKPPRVEQSGRLWTLESQSVLLVGQIDSASATQTIERVERGVRIITTLTAECQKLLLRWPSQPLQVQVGTMVENGKLSLRLTNLNWNPDISAASFDAGTCQGPIGLHSLVQRQGQALLQQKLREHWPELFNAARSALAERMATWQGTNAWMGRHELPLGYDDVTGAIVNHTIEEHGKGYWLNGELDLRFGGETKKDGFRSYRRRLNFDDKADYSGAHTDSSKNHIIVQVPTSLMNELAIALHAQDRLQFSFLSNQVPAFKDFMNSRVYQLFLWTDMLRFPTKTVFRFHLNTGRGMRWRLYDRDPPSSTRASRTLAGKASTYLRALMEVPQTDGSFIPYMRFETPYVTDVNLSILTGNKLRIKLGDPGDFYLKAGWDKDYLTIQNPHSHFSVETISKALQELLKNQSADVKLPILRLSPKDSFAIQDVHTNSSVMTFSATKAQP